MIRPIALLTGLLLSLAAPAAQAAALQVVPVLLDVASPTVATSIRVTNAGTAPITVQVRVFRWTQVNGEDVLEPTTAVVVSPPIATLQPGLENTVRVIRTATTPVVGEEAYRLLVDELPEPATAREGGVNLLIRHSIPVFFSAAPTLPDLRWSVVPTGGGYAVTASNAGQRRIRIADLELQDAGGRVVAGRGGLAGYVLGGSSVTWVLTGSGLAPGSNASIAARSEAGLFIAPVQLSGG
ncbi:MAG: molecular chaperone [Bauldia sp.]|nr:molecular chaperone [Bauldia sp.]